MCESNSCQKSQTRLVPNQILIINGPNLNLVGRREPEIYGSQSLDDYISELDVEFPQIDIGHFQSNHEGALIDKLHEVGFDSIGIILNAGGYSHTSIALRDAVAAIEAPVIEVHISNIYEREAFRWKSLLTDVCQHHFIGHGVDGYKMAVEYLLGL